MIHIVMAGDDNYMPHMAAAAASCVVNTAEPVALYALSDNISETSKERLRKSLAALNKQTELRFIDITPEKLKGLKGEGHITAATYMRYFIPEILPDVDKVIYLDTDLIVRKDLSPLYDTDVSGYPLAAVREPYMERKYRRRCGIPPNTPVFNAGVLLMNLKYWRETGLGQKALEYSLKTGRNDQKTLNKLLVGNFLPLNLTWNVSKGFFREYYKFTCSEKRQAELRPLIKDPAVVHATGKVKLWDREYYYPFRDEFFRYLAMTEWKDAEPPKKSVFSEISRAYNAAIVRIMDRMRD